MSSTVTSPESMVSRPPIQLSSVDFPEPLEPCITHIFPFSTDKFIPFNTGTGFWEVP